MKQIFSLVITAISFSLIITSCGDNKNGKNTTSVEENVEPAEKKQLGQGESGIAMAFYYQDSVATQFRFYREIDSLLRVKELNFQKELERKIRAYREFEADVQRRIENDEITGYQLDDIQQTAMQRQQSIQEYEQQQGTALQREALQYQTALMNKLSEAGKEFSQRRGIDLLFYYQKGGQITFINDAHDVTDDFISYLNKREDELKLGFEEEVEALEEEGL